jgi:GntR family transcriptional regulator / MocR family aminotransferase
VDFHVSFAGERDLAGQIYAQVRSAILDGRLRAGEPLPPSRELAQRLGVARNTVCVAYDRLTGEGFVEGRIGAGTFVSGGPYGGRDRTGGEPVPGLLRPRAVWDTVPEPPNLAADQPEFDLRPGLPDARLFPYESWRRVVSRELRASAVGSGAHADPSGHAGLRAAIARHVGVSRGVRAEPADVMVTNGIQQALDLVGRVLLEPGARVAVEDPGYPPPRLLFTSLGATVVPVPVDAEGLVVDALPTTSGSFTSARPTSSRSACRCRCADGGRCSPGHPSTARRSSRTTTTASSGSRGTRSSRCTAWTGAGG